MRRAARDRRRRRVARSRADQHRSPDRPPGAHLKTALINALRLLAGRRPRLGFSVARVLAWLSRPLGRGIPEETLAEVFPHLPPRALRTARRRTEANFLPAAALNAPP